VADSRRPLTEEELDEQDRMLEAELDEEAAMRDFTPDVARPLPVPKPRPPPSPRPKPAAPSGPRCPACKGKPCAPTCGRQIGGKLATRKGAAGEAAAPALLCSALHACGK